MVTFPARYDVGNALGAALLALGLAGCGGLSDRDRALCEDLDEMNVYMDTQGVGYDETSAKSTFTRLQAADNDDLAQVGRDYLAAGADPFTASEYEKRAQKICRGG